MLPLLVISSLSGSSQQSWYRGTACPKRQACVGEWAERARGREDRETRPAVQKGTGAVGEADVAKGNRADDEERS